MADQEPTASEDNKPILATIDHRVVAVTEGGGDT